MAPAQQVVAHDEVRRRPARRRLPSIIRAPLKVATALILAFILVSFQSDIETQDAEQYRINFREGVYADGADLGKHHWFGVVVRFVSDALAVDDPFFVIGVLVCASFILRAMQMRLSPGRWLVFIVMLLMPSIYFNWTQVLRQGVASALILHGLTVPSMLPAAALLGLGGLVHQVFTPFAAITLGKLFLFRPHGWATRSQRVQYYARLMDKALVVALPLGMAALFLLGMNVLEHDRATIYFNQESSSLKRAFVSPFLLYCAWLAFQQREGLLAAFTVYLLIFAAVLLPFAHDFTRLQTVVAPFLLFTALECRSQRRAAAMILILLGIAIYVNPSTGINALL